MSEANSYNSAINAALADGGLNAQLRELGGNALSLSPAGFEQLIVDETLRWAKVIKAAGVKLD